MAPWKPAAILYVFAVLLVSRSSIVLGDPILNRSSNKTSTSEVVQKSSDVYSILSEAAGAAGEATEVPSVDEAAVTSRLFDEGVSIVGPAETEVQYVAAVQNGNDTSGSGSTVSEEVPPPGTTNAPVEPSATSALLFKCPDSILDKNYLDTPTWLQQYMSPNIKDLKAQKYGDSLFRFQFSEDQFQCDSSQEFSLDKSQLEGQFQGLQADPKNNCPHCMNALMDALILPNGYLKYLNAEKVNFYYPPTSYCISRIDDTSFAGLLCPFNDTSNPAPKIRRCAAMGFTLKMDPIENPLILNLSEEDLSWTPFFDEGSDSSPPSHHPHPLPIYWQARLPCRSTSMYVSEPLVSTAHRIIYYKAIKVLGDGSIMTRAKATSPWIPASTDLWASDYCIDGYVYPPDSINATQGASYLHKLNRQVIRACSTPEVPQASYKAIYFYVLFISTVLLGVIVLIYGLVWPKQNIHGRTSAAFLFCMFIYFVTLMIGNAEKNYGSLPCVINGILQHYFQLAMFYWMAVMNFDVWSTIRSMVAVSQRGKGNKRFALYCSFAFTCPAIVVATGIAIQKSYSLDQDQIVLPLYGYEQCALDKDSQLYYFLWPTSFVFVIGIAFGLMTMYTLHKLKKDTKRISNSNTKNAQKQWHVILKLSLLTGVSWVADLVWSIWAPDITWWWFILDTYNFFQPFFLFWIFVMKKEIRTQLCDKYPMIFQRLFALLDRMTSKMPAVGGGKGVRSTGETHTTGLSSTFQSQSEA